MLSAGVVLGCGGAHKAFRYALDASMVLLISSVRAFLRGVVADMVEVISNLYREASASSAATETPPRSLWHHHLVSQ